MVKRKAASSEDESDRSTQHTDEELTEEKPKAKLTKSVKRVKEERKPSKKRHDSAEASGNTAKKPQKGSFETNELNSNQVDNGAHVKTTAEGDKCIELGKKKKVVARKYNKVTLIDIREFYGDEGDEKPGKKGIALSVEQWEALKQCADKIDELCAALK